MSILERLLVIYGASLPDHPRKWWLHERLRNLLHVTVNEEVEVVRKGLKWRLTPADYTDSSLFWLNSRDDWDLLHLHRLLCPGATVIDVGANFGYYSLMLATALKRQCSIIACEPHPVNFQRLKGHVNANNMTTCVKIFPIGVSDHEEVVCMHRPADNSGHAMIKPSGETADVRLTTLDNLCLTEGIDRLDLLILDVEGYEQRALHGAEEVLSRFTPVVFVELFPPVMRRQGADPDSVFVLLIRQGYRFFVARKERLIPLQAPPMGEERENVFAFHEKHFVTGIAPPVSNQQ